MKKSEEKVFQLIARENQPLRLDEIYKKAEAESLSMATVSRAVRELHSQKMIITISTPNSTYYTISKDNTERDNEPSQIKKLIDEETVNIKDTFKELQSQINTADSKISNIYANIISIMGVFVAIFSLISVNAKVVFDLTQNKICDVIWSVVAVNAVTVISIIILLIGVYLITKNKKK